MGFKRFLLLPILLTAIQGRTITKISQDEVTAALNEMAADDENAAGAKDLVINYQEMASVNEFTHDNAPQPLFTSVSSSLLARPTYRTYKALQALYKIPDIYTADPNSAERIAAAKAFIDAVYETKVMKAAYRFLAYNGLMSMDEVAFKQDLLDFWFTPYMKDTVAEGSSGFESVFVGELHGSFVLGMNYWYRFLLLEEAGKVNYHGYLSRVNNILLEIQFMWGTNKAKNVAFLLGTSPEFDFAAYTVCALANAGDCTYKHSGEHVVLTTKTITPSGGTPKIDSVYPTDGGSLTVKPGLTTTEPADPRLQALVDLMREADEDRPIDYTLNWGKAARGGADKSPDPLFTYVNEELFKKAQYAALINVYDKELFTADVCTEESPTGGFRKQYFKSVFDAFTNTTVFQLAYYHLVDIGVVKSYNTFLSELFTLWFGRYSRCKGPMGSSGFEHVFLGEFKGSVVDGQHNWVRFYLLEKEKMVNYLGFFHYDAQLTGTFQYYWDFAFKNVGGFNTGTSPAFDFALFSVCALSASGKEGCRFKIDGFPIAVTSFTQDCEDVQGRCLSTVYPSDN